MERLSITSTEFTCFEFVEFVRVCSEHVTQRKKSLCSDLLPPRLAFERKSNQCAAFWRTHKLTYSDCLSNANEINYNLSAYSDFVVMLGVATTDTLSFARYTSCLIVLVNWIFAQSCECILWASWEHRTEDCGGDDDEVFLKINRQYEMRLSTKLWHNYFAL